MGNLSSGEDGGHPFAEPGSGDGVRDKRLERDRKRGGIFGSFKGGMTFEPEQTGDLSMR